jgi:hypothetical protein
MKGWGREREWTHRGGNPAAGGTWHRRHCGDGWNQWRQRLDDRRRKKARNGLGWPGPSRLHGQVGRFDRVGRMTGWAS